MAIKEQIIRSHKNPEILCQILDGKVVMLTDDNNGKRKDDDTICIDNEEYIYEIYKVLKKADELGAFDFLKKEVDDDFERDTEEILV